SCGEDRRSAGNPGNAVRHRAPGKGAGADGERDLGVAGRKAYPLARQAPDGEDPARILSQRADEGDPEGARRRRRPRRACRSGGEDCQDQAVEGSAREGTARIEEAAPDVADVRRGDRRAQLSRLAIVYSVEQEVQSEKGSGGRPSDSGCRSLWP